MKKIKVEGYEVTVERDEGIFIVSVPELPGCTIQVDKEKDIEPAIKGVIGDYLMELVSKKPKTKKAESQQPRRGDKRKAKM